MKFLVDLYLDGYDTEKGIMKELMDARDAAPAERRPDSNRSEQGHLASCSYWADGPDSCNCVSQIREVRCNDCDSVLTPKQFEDITYVDPCPHCARAEYVKALEAEHEGIGLWHAFVESKDPWKKINIAQLWANVEAAKKGREQ